MEDHARLAFDLAYFLADPRKQADVLINLGQTLLRLGRLDEAEIQINAGLHIHRDAGNQPSTVVAQGLLPELPAQRPHSLNLC